MRPRIPFLLFTTLWGAGWAQFSAARAQQAPPPLSCSEAADIAERDAGLPSGLLLAIGRIESGRYDKASGKIAPWPWTANVAGAGYYFENKDVALNFLHEQRARGVQSVDVGCFQVNLFYHPQAFATPEEAFDPLANAKYAASFLSRLHNQTGAWESAVAMYHSAVPERGQWYREQVLASWNNGGAATLAPSVHSLLAAPRVTSTDPYVIMVSAVLHMPERTSGIRVWTPSASTHANAQAESLHAPLPQVQAPAKTIQISAGGRHLPRVITP